MLAYFMAALESDSDKRIFRELYERHNPMIERIALGMLKNQQDAEEAVQNTYVQIIRHFEKIFEIPCDKLPFWIICIVKNEARTILRKKKRYANVDNFELFAAEAENVTEYKALVELFTRLPDTYREAMEMSLVLGCSGKEIAKHLGISVTAVNTRISRGRELLRKILEKEGYHP